MAKQHIEKRTVIIIPEDPEAMAAVSTFDRKWINKMETHVENDHAEEVESSVPGAREFEFPRKMLRIPFHREPRSWTEEQKEIARERLIGVRAAVAEQRAAKAAAVAKAAKLAAKSSKTVVSAKSKGKPAPAPKKSKFVVEEDEDDEIEEEEIEEEEVEEEEVEEEDDVDEEVEEDDEEEDEEEVIVKKPVSKKAPARGVAKKLPAKKGKR